MNRKMRSDTIRDLLQLTVDRGITSATMSPWVTRACTYPYRQAVGDVGDALMLNAINRAASINAKGRTEQLVYLLQVWGPTRLRRELTEIGSALDGFAYRVHTDPAEVQKDIGRSFNEDGSDVI